MHPQVIALGTVICFAAVASGAPQFAAAFVGGFVILHFFYSIFAEDGR